MKNQGMRTVWGRSFCASLNLLGLGVAGLLLMPLGSRAAGVVDPGFTMPVAYQGSSQLAVRALAGGKTMLVTQGTVTRLNENGSEDGNYQVAQIASANAQAATVLPDGRVVLAGRQPLTINGTPYGSIVRLLANGVVDPGFESLAGNNFIDFRTVLMDSQDRVYLGLRSHSNTLGGQSVGRLVRLRADGTLDAEWQPNFGNIVNPSIAMFPNDDLLLARSNLEVVRLSPAGEIQPGFASQISPVAGNNSFSLVDPAQRPVMGSLFIDSAFAYTNSLVRLLPNGVIDPGFIPRPVTDQGYQVMAVDRFGRYYAGGSFLSYGGVARTRLMRLFPDGSLDESFVADANAPVTHLAFTADGLLLVGGAFNQINGVNASRLARLLVDDLTAPPAFALVNTNLYELDSATSITVPVMRVGPTNAPASVDFATTVGTATMGVDFGEAAGTLQFAAGEDLKLITITIPDSTSIGPDRDFFLTLSNPEAGTALGDRATMRVTLLESNSEVSFAIADLTVPEATGAVQLPIQRTGTRSVTGVRLQTIDGTALAGSHYRLPETIIQFKEGETSRNVRVDLIDNADENPDRSFVVAVDAVAGAEVVAPAAVNLTIADDDAPDRPGFGFAWPDGRFGIYAIHEDALGNRAIGGSFTGVNGLEVTNFVRLLSSGDVDPGFYSAIGPNNAVFSIIEDGQGRLLVAGDFTAYSGIAVGRIARLSVDGSLDPNFATGTGFNELVERIEILPDGRILAGGLFDSFNGVPRRGVAILKSTGELDETFDPVTGIPQYASFFGHGAFQSPEGVLVAGHGETNSIFRLSSTGRRDPEFFVTLGNNTEFITGLLVQPDGRIVIGGVFSTVNGVARNNLARLNSDSSLDTSFDPGTGPDNWVFRLYRISDGRLLLVGHFLTYDGVPRAYAARIHEDGSLDSSFDAAISPAGTAGVGLYCASIAADGTVTLAGTFQEVQGIRRLGLAAIGPDGGVVLQVPAFLSTSFQGNLFQLGVAVEPDLDVRLLKSGSLPGMWTPVSTNRTFKRVLQFAPELLPAGSELFQAEMLVPE